MDLDLSMPSIDSMLPFYWIPIDFVGGDAAVAVAVAA